MKTKKELQKEMLESLQNDKLRLEILRDFRQHVYDNDEELKGNLEAKKELDANEFQIRNSVKMITWIEDQLK